MQMQIRRAYWGVQPCAVRIVVTFNVRCAIPDILPLVFPVVLRDVLPPVVLVEVPAVPVVVPAAPAPAVVPPVAEVPAPEAPVVLRPALPPDALLPIPDSGASEPTISTH